MNIGNLGKIFPSVVSQILKYIVMDGWVLKFVKKRYFLAQMKNIKLYWVYGY